MTGIHLTVAGYSHWVDYLCTHVPYNKNNPYQQGSTYYLSDELRAADCGPAVNKGKYRIILSADTASEVRQLLSQKRR